MALEQYDPCPCGSSKKFKWCCQPIHVEIERAYQQEEQGQHDSALRIMDEVIAQHPTNPEPHGRKALLLYRNNRVDDAENALQRAFDLNPQYPFGLMLRGMFRMNEGEIVGALLSFRKASEAYDPEAHSHLGGVYANIADCEMRMNRPMAFRAALKQAVRHDPTAEELRSTLDSISTGKAGFPASATKEHAFLSPPARAAGERRQAWDRALAPASKLSEVAQAFQQLTQDDPSDTAAWFNLALVRAWLGDNRPAIEALDHYIEQEGDEAKAAEAMTLAMILRQGQGLEEDCDFLEYSRLFEVRDPNAFLRQLELWQQEGRFVPFRFVPEQNLLTGMLLERKLSLTAETAASQVVGLGAYLLFVQNTLRLWFTESNVLAKMCAEIAQPDPTLLKEVQTDLKPASFNDLLAEAIGFTLQKKDAPEPAGETQLHDYTSKFLEEVWVHRPMKALKNAPPIDAAGSPALRKRLLGVVKFLQEVAANQPVGSYDFDRLRRKLGLLAAGAITSAAPDIASMGAAELAALAAESLAEEQLEQAFQCAVKLDARELAGRFARALIAQPIAAGQQRDRFPWFTHLVQQALTDGDQDAALNHVNEGEKDDCEHNEGRRRNDYELRRGQVHMRRGEIDAAYDVFNRLVERSPAELRYRGSAAEAMLSARRKDNALHFAEVGLTKAREKNDRDSENYFRELVEAARRLG